METKTKNKPEYKFVYKKDYAMQLIAKGHQVFTTMPNPQKSNFIMWVFIDDATFDRDFKALKGGGSRND